MKKIIFTALIACAPINGMPWYQKADCRAISYALLGTAVVFLFIQNKILTSENELLEKKFYSLRRGFKNILDVQDDPITESRYDEEKRDLVTWFFVNDRYKQTHEPLEKITKNYGQSYKKNSRFVNLISDEFGVSEIIHEGNDFTKNGDWRIKKEDNTIMNFAQFVNYIKNFHNQNNTGIIRAN